jgi:hypothetical protein
MVGTAPKAPLPTLRLLVHVTAIDSDLAAMNKRRAGAKGKKQAARRRRPARHGWRASLAERKSFEVAVSCSEAASGMLRLSGLCLLFFQIRSAVISR